MRKTFLALAFLALTLPVNATPSAPGLSKKYNTYNAQYFNSRLPKNALVFYAPISQDGEMGDTRDCGDGQLCVRLDPEFNKAPRVAGMTLLHEMCHMDTLGGGLDPHGPKFQACMYRLTALGAFNELW